MLLEKRKTIFRGLDSAIKDRMKYTERLCRSGPDCNNQCKLKIYNFGGRHSIWGGECGRYELKRNSTHRKENYFELWQKIWQTHMNGVYEVF